MLSTRRDLVPVDIADELAKLQDRVPPFPRRRPSRFWKPPTKAADRGIRRIRRHSGRRASVAQCISPPARRQGRCCQDIAPGNQPVIGHDVELLHAAAGLLEKLFADGKRCVRAKWWRNSRNTCRTNSTSCAKRPMLAVAAQLPGFAAARGAEVYWDYCENNVMVMDRMDGIPSAKSTPCVPPGWTS